MTTKDPTHTRAIRTFVPELTKLRRARQKTVYEGPIGRIGTTPRSRYTLVALSALVTLIALVITAATSPNLAVLTGLGAVLLIAGGWPAATGIGRRPTVDDSTNAAVTCETYVPDFAGDLYGTAPVLEFHRYLCPVRKFRTLEELSALIRRAAEESKAYFAAQTVK